MSPEDSHDSQDKFKIASTEDCKEEEKPSVEKLVQKDENIVAKTESPLKVEKVSS